MAPVREVILLLKNVNENSKKNIIIPITKKKEGEKPEVLNLYNNVAIAFKAEMINVHTRYLHYK